MQIDYTTEAFASLLQLINYIESNNTKDAGLRWLQRFEVFFRKKCIPHIKLSFATTKLFINLIFVVFFNDWVIAFSLHENNILIEALLNKSRITD